MEQRLWQLIREDWESHGRDWTQPGFRATAIHRFGVWRMKLRPKFVRAPMSILYRWLYRRVRNHYGIDLPYSVRLGRRVVIEHCGTVVIHGNASIGDACVIRQGVTIGMSTTDRPFDAPELGERVDIAARPKILGKIRIGDGAHIGANAVVLGDVPPGAVAVGVPARIIQRSAAEVHS